MAKQIKKLLGLGQSIWYDNIHRELLLDGTLKEMIERGEIRGVTSNPSIFNKAIGQSDLYAEDISTLTAQGLSKEQIYEALAVKDIQMAADAFRDLYEESEGADGYVSLEVSPYLATDTAGTIAEAKRLWKTVDRPNLMVKIPATKEGLPAIAESIAEGININVTLIFGLDRYDEVREAYLAGLEKRIERGGPVDGIASVASFFISRIDTKVDQRLMEIIEKAEDEKQSTAHTLLGTIAVASGKLAYADYQETFADQNPRFQALKQQGAKRQRVLWASTSTKNPDYSDVKYVEEMVGPGTINTVPQKTLDAFQDHGTAEKTIDQGVENARQQVADLADLGIDLDQVTQELEEEGVKKFADSFTALLETIRERMDKLGK